MLSLTCFLIITALFSGAQLIEQNGCKVAIALDAACDFDAEMSALDCTARHVHVKDVCVVVTKYSVSVLKAGENNLGKITADMMTGCENVTELDLHYNQLVEIEPMLLVNFKQLKILDLRANNIKMYSGAFSLKGLPNTVEVLKIGGNVPIEPWRHRLRYPDISSLTSLKQIFLDGFSSQFESGYGRLRSLSLSAKSRFTFCNITQVTNTTFSKLANVEYLNLSYCNITTISAGAFAMLRRLKSLDLSLNIRLGFNALGQFSYGLQFTNISFLNISNIYPTFGIGTVLKKEHICYLKNTSLKVLDVSQNSVLTAEPNAFLLVPETLEKLYGNDNKPSFGPYLAQLGCASNVQYVQGNNQNKYHSPVHYLIDSDIYGYESGDIPFVSHCTFMTEENLRRIASTIPNCNFIERKNYQTIFNITFPINLKTVEFKKCSMNYRVTAKLIINTNSLENADFSSNGLYGFIGPIGPFPKARKLILSNNHCEEIGPNFFDNMTTIRILDLSDNFLGPFFKTDKGRVVFDKLSELQELNLAQNKITSLHSQTFKQLILLEKLVLDENNLKRFHINADYLKSLLILSLVDNSLSTLPLKLGYRLMNNSHRLSQNFSIDLSGNELTTECSNIKFLTWIYKHRANMKNFRNYTFSKDNHINTLNDSSIAKLQKNCISYTVIIVICSIFLAIFFSLLIGGMLYKNRWKIRYFLYMSKVGVFGYQRLEERRKAEFYRFDAFISYAEENLRFVTNGIIPNLEKPEENIALCIHQRDFVAGNAISENIIDAITKSRKTVIVLSKSFIKRRWCIYEFNMARMESMYNRDNNHIVLVMLEDVSIKEMPLEMAAWIKDNSYIEYTSDEQGELLFWNNLKTAILS